MRRLIVGCGYLGQRVAQRWHVAADSVYAVTRSEQRAETFAAAGYQPIVADITKPEQLAELPTVDTVLFAVGFDRSSGKTIDEVYVAGLQNVLEVIPGDPQFIYISSVGVYGQTDGSWIDEQSVAQPTRPGGAACLAAEQRLLASRFGPHSVVLRLAGIYGPDRVPLVDKIRAGEPIPNPPAGYLNLIHVDDAAQIVIVTADARLSGQTYCVADGHPAVRRDYYARVAELTGAPAPTYTDAPPAEGSRRRGGSNKRVRNDRLLADFPLTLDYPSYREGLAAILTDAR